MKKGRGESGGEDSGAGNLIFREEEEWNCDKKTNQQSCDERMKVGATKHEISGGAEKIAEQLQVGDGSCGEDGKRYGTSDAGESRALQGIGGERVGERIHKGILQRATSRQPAAMES